jgi:hypothetical protein
LNVSGGGNCEALSNGEGVSLKFGECIYDRKNGTILRTKSASLVVGFCSSWKLLFSVGIQKKLFYNFNTPTYGGLKKSSF